MNTKQIEKALQGRLRVQGLFRGKTLMFNGCRYVQLELVYDDKEIVLVRAWAYFPGSSKPYGEWAFDPKEITGFRFDPSAEDRL